MKATVRHHRILVKVAIIKKNLRSTIAGKGVEKTSYTIGGDVNWYSYNGKQYGGSANKK